MDKECDLQKIAFHSYLETSLNSQLSFLAGGLIGILILIITLFYDGVFDVFGGRFLGFIPFAVVLVGIFYAFSRILKHIKDQQTQHLSLIFELISNTEKGEPMPSLTDLKKKVNPKNN